MRQSRRGSDPALRHALDHAFRRRLEVQVLRHQPFDQRGQLKIPEAFPPEYVDRTSTVRLGTLSPFSADRLVVSLISGLS